MKNADELKSSMRPGRIYRRQDLEGLLAMAEPGDALMVVQR